VHAPPATWNWLALAVPTFVNVTSVLWLEPGVSGALVPPYLLIVAQDAPLVGLALDRHVCDACAAVPSGPVSRRITAAAVETVLVLLVIIA